MAEAPILNNLMEELSTLCLGTKKKIFCNVGRYGESSEKVRVSWASNPLFMTSKWNLHPRGGTGDGEGERMRPRLPSKRNCKEDRAVPIHYEESSTSSSSSPATNALHCGWKWRAVASGSPTKEFNFQSKCRSSGRVGKELILHFAIVEFT